MKAARWIILAAAIAFVLPAQAQDRPSGPTLADQEPGAARDAGGTELILYRFPGVRDNGGGSNAGVATVFHCTNFSGATETIRIVIRDSDTAVLANTAFNIFHLNTRTASTHSTSLYLDDFVLSPGSVIAQGTAAIAATSTSIICTAMTIDAASASPVGIALRGIRFNPAPGSQE
jgi:hypothetical protein